MTYSLRGTGTEFVSDIRIIAIKNCTNGFNPCIASKLMPHNGIIQTVFIGARQWMADIGHKEYHN